MAWSSKGEVLDEYKRMENKRGREYAVSVLRRNIREKSGEQSQWRREIAEEYFGIYDAPPARRAKVGLASLIPDDLKQGVWDKQLAELLSDKTPIWIKE